MPTSWNVTPHRDEHGYPAMTGDDCMKVMGALLTDSGRVNGTVPGWPIRGPHGLRRGARLAGISQSARRRSLFGDSSLYV